MSWFLFDHFQFVRNVSISGVCVYKVVILFVSFTVLRVLFCLMFSCCAVLICLCFLFLRDGVSVCILCISVL